MRRPPVMKPRISAVRKREVGEVAGLELFLQASTEHESRACQVCMRRACGTSGYEEHSSH